MAQSQVLEGTWEELSLHAPLFHGKRLRLTIMEEVSEELTHDGEKARIAAIHAGMGKFADPTRQTLASEELRLERKRDDMRLHQK